MAILRIPLKSFTVECIQRIVFVHIESSFQLIVALIDSFKLHHKSMAPSIIEALNYVIFIVIQLQKTKKRMDEQKKCEQ